MTAHRSRRFLLPPSLARQNPKPADLCHDHANCAAARNDSKKPPAHFEGASADVSSCREGRSDLWSRFHTCVDWSRSAAANLRTRGCGSLMSGASDLLCEWLSRGSPGVKRNSRCQQRESAPYSPRASHNLAPFSHLAHQAHAQPPSARSLPGFLRA